MIFHGASCLACTISTEEQGEGSRLHKSEKIILKDFWPPRRTKDAREFKESAQSNYTSKSKRRDKKHRRMSARYLREA